jgi:hypothetical protein
MAIVSRSPSASLGKFMDAQISWYAAAIARVSLSSKAADSRIDGCTALAIVLLRVRLSNKGNHPIAATLRG